MDLKEKFFENKNKIMLGVIILLIVGIIGVWIYFNNREKEYKTVSYNDYNMAFYELVDYVQNVENYLLKAQVSSTSQHSAEVMTYLWREANLAQSYLSRLPIENEDLSNTAKFLNQVSDYSYSLSRKNIYGTELTSDDFKNIEELHNYSLELKNTLNQLATDINEGRISWDELDDKGKKVFAQQVSNVSKDSFNSLEENFHEYEGLIYDGAFSEHLTGKDKKGLTGNDLSEDECKQKINEYYGDKIETIDLDGKYENATIPVYEFNVKLKDFDTKYIVGISIKGGHLVYINADRDVNVEVISQEQANNIGKDFLKQVGYNDMKETYYLKENGIVTINYAYYQSDVVVYPDLIKVKVALDNGEVLGVEAMGYLNCHTTRELKNIKVSKDSIIKKLNPNVEVQQIDLAIIPTQWQTENMCWEVKGKVKDHDFLVYFNVETGKEDDVLVIINTPNGTLTM